MDKNTTLIRLSEGPHVALGKIPFREQNETQRVFTAIWELEAEVNNGGFYQYFFNTSGESAESAEWALTTIGASNTAKIVLEAISIFPGGTPPSDVDERRQRLELADECVRKQWDELDQAFYEYPDSLTELLYAFVKSHPEEFGDVP